MTAIALTLFLYSLFCFTTIIRGQEDKSLRVLRGLIDDSIYDRMEEPPPFDETTIVSVGMFVASLSSPRPATMDYKMDCNIRTKWIDSRLEHNVSNYIRLTDMNLFNEMWQPDIYFPSVKNIQFQKALIPNFIAYVYPNGSVFASRRYLLTVGCDLDLSEFPLDEQICSLQLQSWYTLDTQVNYTFFETNPIELDTTIATTEMTFLGADAVYTPKSFFSDRPFVVGVYSGVTFNFYMSRKIGYHITQTFIPTAMVVCLSWTSFWFDVSLVQARLSICILTLLILNTQAAGIKQNLPPVSYIKAVDVWMGVCLLMVFGSLLEFCYGCYRAANAEATDKSNVVKRVDDVSKIAFPSVFIAFNVFFWFYYNF